MPDILEQSQYYTGLLAACVATAPPVQAMIAFPNAEPAFRWMVVGRRDLSIKPYLEQPVGYCIEGTLPRSEVINVSYATNSPEMRVVTRLEIFTAGVPSDADSSWSMKSRLFDRSMMGVAFNQQWMSHVIDFAMQRAITVSVQRRDHNAVAVLGTALCTPNQYRGVPARDVQQMLVNRRKRAVRDEVPFWILDAITCWIRKEMFNPSSLPLQEPVSFKDGETAFWNLVRDYNDQVHPIVY
ncbi:MAG: hypothetical protein NUV56_00530 [Candidatus Uhrbacteria bacterium]|nr:hypothetical protein [Candidatus Uhrbacteria bacterium]